MVSNKIGTQNWSKATQTPGFQQDNTHLTPATAPSATSSGKEGEQSIGEKLNQIANPGGKDPTRQARKAHNTLDKDDFMKLMLTQMKNQDPMNPLQSHEMAAQLAQFTSLEQLYNVNKNLEGLGKSQEPMQKYEALNFLGKTIKSDSKEIFRQAGDTASDLRFNLGADAMKTKLTIMDDQGQVVKSMELGVLKQGPNKIVWGGADSQDRDVKPGHYIFSVEAQNASGHKIGVQTATHGTITGVNYTAEGPMLMIGDQKIRLQDVQKIEDEGLKEKQSAGENHILIPDGASEGSAAGAAGGAVTGANAAAGANAGAAAGIIGNIGVGGRIETDPAKVEAKLKAENQQKLSQAFSNSSKRPKVKPEDKPEAKLTGAVIPLEVASSNAQGASHAGTVSTGGAFGSR